MEMMDEKTLRILGKRGRVTIPQEVRDAIGMARGDVVSFTVVSEDAATQDRPLSVAEYARIQQFPVDWVITGTMQERYKQIGKAVPVGLAKAIGDAIVSVAAGKAEVKVKRVRGTGVHSRIQAAIGIGGNSDV